MLNSWYFSFKFRKTKRSSPLVDITVSRPRLIPIRNNNKSSWTQSVMKSVSSHCLRKTQDSRKLLCSWIKSKKDKKFLQKLNCSWSFFEVWLRSQPRNKRKNLKRKNKNKRMSRARPSETIKFWNRMNSTVDIYFLSAHLML